MSFFFQKGGGVSTKPKVLRHFLFALKQSKANKCQCAKRLKTVKKNFFEIFVKLFWKKVKKVPRKFQKEGGGSEAFGNKLIFEPTFLFGSLP